MVYYVLGTYLYTEFYLYWQERVVQFYSSIQYAQKCHMHINSTRHFFKMTYMSILNLVLKSSDINIDLLYDKIFILCHELW